MQKKRSVAQAGSALVLGTKGHRFDSYLSEAFASIQMENFSGFL